MNIAKEWSLKVVDYEKQLREKYTPENCTDFAVREQLYKQTLKVAREFVLDKYIHAHPMIVGNKVAIFDTQEGVFLTEKENYAKEQYRTQRLGEFYPYIKNYGGRCLLEAYRLAAKQIVQSNPLDIPELFSSHWLFSIFDELLTKVECSIGYRE
jgi:hypothetical protein